MSCTVYIGIPMTGYDKEEMIEISRKACELAKSYGLEPWSPVLNERIEGTGKLRNDKKALDWKWEMDKEALNRCFVFVNLRADEKSFGCEDEYGRHRYSEWQPSFRVSPKHAAGYVSVANYQTDGIFGSQEACFEYIAKHFGTIYKRRVWKLELWNRCLPTWVGRQFRRLFQ